MAELLASASWPRACRTAIFAHVPVPHGERSIAPVQVAGRSQSRLPVDTMTALRRAVPADRGPARRAVPIVIPANPGCSGWTTGNCSRAAALIISPTRTISRPSSGVSRSPNALGVGDHVEHPAVRDVDGDRARGAGPRAARRGGPRTRARCGTSRSSPCRRAHSAWTADQPGRRLERELGDRLRIGSMPVSSRTVADADRVRARHRRILDLLHDHVAGIGLGMASGAGSGCSTAAG